MDVTTIPFEFPGLPGVRCAFQMRSRPLSPLGGNISYGMGDDPVRVLETRRSLAAALGIRQWTELAQVHGDVLHFDPSPTPFEEGPVPAGDGTATAVPGQALAIKTADCQPVLIAHCRGDFVAALHVGWRGNRINFPASAVERICARYRVQPSELLAVRGPSLGPARAQFVNFDAEWGADFLPWFDEGTKTMDLWGLTRHQLEQAGVPSRNIHGVDLCTATMDGAFFSYRRDRNCGRQMSLIWILPAS
ncbi:MAG: polyphenol oxidase family protein [Desulfovibrio sp.]|nr:polyphenol oxidase family protein [Desulfovibrio sp.]